MQDERGQEGPSWRETEEYEQALRHRQAGEWDAALRVLTDLAARYPDESGLAAVLDDTRLRLEATGRRSLQRRRLPRINKRLLFLVTLIVLLAAFGVAAGALYRNIITPSLARLQVERGEAALAEQARAALTKGEYAKALEFYDQLAAQNPNHPLLAEGQTQAQEAIALERAYQQAQQQLAAGDLSAAQATLVGLAQRAPTYRDVSALLVKLERQQRLAALLRDAAAGQAAQDWDGVIIRLEEARTLTQRPERDAIEADLYAAYMAQAAGLVEASRGGVGELNRAVQLFNKALSLRPGATEATSQRSWVRQFLAGQEAFTAGRWDSAIAQLEPLCKARPDYMNGMAAHLLYNAYVRSADALLTQDEKARAWERYNRAAAIPGVDTSGARAVAASLGIQLTPTPTPIPTRTPTPAPSATVVPTPTVTPVHVPLTRYRGKIAFFSNREGGKTELWVMDPDGRNAFRPWHQDKVKAEYQALLAAEKRSPDGLSELYVLKARGQDHIHLYVRYPNGKSLQLTDWIGIAYDPVWSPKGHWIAFVSNEPGNDEIFLIGADGQFPKRLTWNVWEWDKHPSWSPDGGRLVFWSNRDVGRGQIWLMNDDGTGQVNLSNNQYEETDPLWIK